MENTRRTLISYLKKNVKKGYTLESLTWALIHQGYSRTSVRTAIEDLHKELADEAPKIKEKPVIVHEIIDENDHPIQLKKPLWKKILDKIL